MLCPPLAPFVPTGREERRLESERKIFLLRLRSQGRQKEQRLTAVVELEPLVELSRDHTRFESEVGSDDVLDCEKRRDVDEGWSVSLVEVLLVEAEGRTDRDEGVCEGCCWRKKRKDSSQ